MKTKKWLVIVTLGAIVIATTFGAILYRSVKAAESDQASNPTNTASQPGRDFRGNGHGGYSSEELATALGITTDELTAAYQKANEAALKQAVDQGLITQAQADEITTDDSAFPLGGRWAGWLSQKGIDFDALLAEALGITVDKLQAAYLQAYNAHIDQAVTDGALTQEQADLMKGQNALYANQAFQSSMQSAFESAVKQAVSDGVITQAQADQILANNTDMKFFSPRGIGDRGMERGPHGENGPDGFGRHGQRGAAPSDSTTTDQPTTTP